MAERDGRRSRPLFHGLWLRHRLRGRTGYRERISSGPRPPASRFRQGNLAANRRTRRSVESPSERPSLFLTCTLKKCIKCSLIRSLARLIARGVSSGQGIKTRRHGLVGSGRPRLYIPVRGVDGVSESPRGSGRTSGRPGSRKTSKLSRRTHALPVFPLQIPSQA